MRRLLSDVSLRPLNSSLAATVGCSMPVDIRVTVRWWGAWPGCFPLFFRPLAARHRTVATQPLDVTEAAEAQRRNR
jgi:hypothetical protein